MYPFAAEDIRTEDTATPGVLAIYGDPLDGAAPALIGIAWNRRPLTPWEIAVVHTAGIDTDAVDEIPDIPLAAARICMRHARSAA